MLSKHNLLKGGYFSVSTPAPLVIDSNERVEKKLAELRERTQKQSNVFSEAVFPNNLEASEVAELLLDAEGDGSDDGFTSGIQAQVVSDAKQEADRIIEEARKEAEELLEHARAEAQEIKQNAYDKGMNDGKKAGYEDGNRDAMIALQEAKMQLEEEKKRLQESYEEQLKEMEPLLVETLAEVYEHVIHVSLRDKSEVVLKLLEDAIHKVEGCKSFIVHVSCETYEQVKAKKEELVLAAATEDVTVEVIEDLALADAECMLETENGIYDCSLDVELDAVKEQIALLSYQAFE